jgi:antitoxin HicB
LPAKSSGSNLAQVKSGPAQDSAQYLNRPYHIVLVQEGDDGGWTAQVEELPGCEARADTADDAARAIRSRMEEWISEALASGREVPEPRDASSYSGRLMLRMPQSLHAELAHAAERDDVSLNQFITGSLAGAVGWRQQDRTEDTPASEPVPEDAGPPSERRAAPRGRPWLGKAMVANAVLLALVGCIAVALLVFAVLHG